MVSTKLLRVEIRVKLVGNEVVVDVAEAIIPDMARRDWLYLVFIAGRKMFD